MAEPGSGPGSSNRLLAGYMAHEFLTKGTLFGQKFDPARAEAVPVSAAEPKRKPGQTGFGSGVKPNRSYADVAQLLKSDGTHIPGIVNPTQLARWIQM
uniref:Embryo sac development arrest 6 n=2 Tax=Chenopodium quinoa TaxID=63459 RepID=A0A803LMM9_CHEQI